MLDRARATMGPSGSGLAEAVTVAWNNTCGDCWEQAPPPSAILGIPPPPLPLFLQRAFNSADADLCSVQCDWSAPVGKVGTVEYVELPRQVVTGPALDDTWLLVLIATCCGILLLGVLLALFLLKSRIERGGKGGGVLRLDVSTLNGRPGKCAGVGKPCEAVLYPAAGGGAADSRALWAALTPRGTTQHVFTTEPQRHKATPPASLPIATARLVDVPSFDNSAFVDSDDPTYAEPLTPIYAEPLPLPGAGTGAGTLRRSAAPRPTVSSPTRIEHPNFTPLNMLNAQRGNHRSLRRQTLARKESDAAQAAAVVL